MRKYIISLLLASTAAFGALGQNTTGSWRVFPMRGTTITRVADMKDKLFYLTGGCLYRYDKTNDESEFLTPGGSLSDYSIKDIYPNPEKNFIAVVYPGGNMDLVYEDGRMVNLPDIRDANLMTTKEIRDVEFDGDKMYVATDFGFVCYDTKDHYVMESGIYKTAFDQICVAGDLIFAVNKTDKKIYAAPVEGRHKDFSVFETWSGLGNPAVTDLKAVGDGSMLYVAGNNIGRAVIDKDTKTLSLTLLGTCNNVKYLERNSGGFFFYSPTQITFIENGTFGVTNIQLGDGYKGQSYSSWDGRKKVWGGDWQGVASFDFSGSAPTVMSQKYQPESSQMFGATYFYPGPDGSSLFIQNINTQGRNFSPCNAYNSIGGTLVEEYNWNDGTFTSRATYKTNGVPDMTEAHGILLDPVDPSVYYSLSSTGGIYVVKDGEYVDFCLDKNAPWDKTWSLWLKGMTFDPDGNLWICDERVSPSYSMQYIVLPADKVATLRTKASSLTPSDWQLTDIPAYNTTTRDYRSFLKFSSKNTTRALHFGDYNTGFLGIDTKGTVNVSDDSYGVAKSMTTQDGNNIAVAAYHCLVEDKKGRFWIGSDEGVFVVEDIDQLGHSNTLNVIRPKVSRNDGTVFADYLLSTDRVLSIAIDPNDRKWIATEASGLFLVNADGTEILQNFTKDNSPLPSNEVWAVYCDPNGNGVLVNTPAGMYLYNSTSSPAADSYDDVYAYPNPVTPDYQGWITVRGLMNDSLVKIADMQGNVVAQGRSEGGMYVWDGCNSAGQRVRSGVYLVLASQYDGSKSSGAVTKIVVIN